MDKQLVSEAGTYLKDVSGKGFEYYVQGVWATSIMWASIGLVLFLLGIALIPAWFKVRKVELQKNEEEGDDIHIVTILTCAFVVILILGGFITVLCHLSGIVAPEYTAIQRLITTIRGEQ